MFTSWISLIGAFTVIAPDICTMEVQKAVSICVCRSTTVAVTVMVIYKSREELQWFEVKVCIADIRQWSVFCIILDISMSLSQDKQISTLQSAYSFSQSRRKFPYFHSMYSHKENKYLFCILMVFNTYDNTTITVVNVL